MLNRPHRKSMAEYGIPFRQQKDFRCIIFEIIAECAPFAASNQEIVPIYPYQQYDKMSRIEMLRQLRNYRDHEEPLMQLPQV